MSLAGLTRQIAARERLFKYMCNNILEIPSEYNTEQIWRERRYMWVSWLHVLADVLYNQHLGPRRDNTKPNPSLYINKFQNTIPPAVNPSTTGIMENPNQKTTNQSARFNRK